MERKLNFINVITINKDYHQNFKFVTIMLSIERYKVAQKELYFK